MSLLDRLKSTSGGAPEEKKGGLLQGRGGQGSESGGGSSVPSFQTGGGSASAGSAAPSGASMEPSTKGTSTGVQTGTGSGVGAKATQAGVKQRLLVRKPTQEKSEDERLWDFKSEIQDRLVDSLDAEQLKDVGEDERVEMVRSSIEELVQKVGAEWNVSFSTQSHKSIVQDIVDEVVGLGPMEALIRDESISEIMVNGPRQIYVERGGKLQLSERIFRDNDHVMHVIHKIVAPLGRHIDESTPMVDARLKDGSRVNAIIPPLALNGPTITIRKFAKEKLMIQDLIKFGTLTEEMADFIAACVKIKLNIVVSGGTGSGKTTTLNILSSFIPPDERIITIEDAAELQLRQEHVISLETRPPNIEGKGEITIRDLVKNCLRMRPERIIVGEIRGGEALDMLQAMNTGHDGSLTTGHANSPRDMLARLETMVMMAGMDLPSKAIREQISSAIDLIVQQNRLRDGSRKITHITEVQGMEGDVITLTDIFRFEQTGVDENGKIIGRLKPTGIRPKFMNKFKEEGIILPSKIFMSDGGGNW